MIGTHIETLEAGCAITPETLLPEARCQHIEARNQRPPTLADLPQLFDFGRILRPTELDEPQDMTHFLLRCTIGMRLIWQNVLLRSCSRCGCGVRRLSSSKGGRWP